MDVYPSLTYRDVESALEFLQRAFGFQLEELAKDDTGAVRFATLRHGEGLVLQPFGPIGPGRSTPSRKTVPANRAEAVKLTENPGLLPRP